MAKNNFAGALSAVLVHEGGYVDHPADPGGATNMGITRKTLARWRGISPWSNLPKSEVQRLTQEEAGRIYRDGYWDKVRGDDLPSGVDLAVFDFAVNSGPARAAIYLQTIVGAAPDGEIGPLTITAVNAYCVRFGGAKLINELCSQRLAFLERLSTWPTFGKGWSRRVAEMRKQSLVMAAAQPTGGVSPAPAPKPVPTSGLPEPASKSPASAAAAVIIAIVGGLYAFLKSQGILP